MLHGPTRDCGRKIVQAEPKIPMKSARTPCFCLKTALCCHYRPTHAFGTGTQGQSHKKIGPPSDSQTPRRMAEGLAPARAGNAPSDEPKPGFKVVDKEGTYRHVLYQLLYFVYFAKLT